MTTRPTPRRRPRRRPEAPRDDLLDTVDGLLRSMQTLGTMVDQLHGTIRVIDQGTQAMTAFLVRQITVLKTLLLTQGLVSPDAMARADSLTECEAMWDGPPDASPGGPQSRPPEAPA